MGTGAGAQGRCGFRVSGLVDEGFRVWDLGVGGV